MKGNVTGHYVAVRPDKIEKISAGGIILDTEFDEGKRSRELAATTTGTIVSIGPDAWRAFRSKKPWAKVGDKVVYVRHVAKIIEDKDELEDGKPIKIFVMADENIIWRLEDDEVGSFEEE